GGIMQWLAMIAILVAQNAQGEVQDKQVEHLHQLGVTTHTLVVENTELTEAIHEHLIKTPSGVQSNNGGHRGELKPGRRRVPTRAPSAAPNGAARRSRAGPSSRGWRVPGWSPGEWCTASSGSSP